MVRIRNMSLLTLCALLIATGESPQIGWPLDVEIQLSKTTILLGEPVWVDVSVTNRSSEALRVDMGNSCFGTKELTIQVPAAEHGGIDHAFCGGVPGGSCGVEIPPLLPAGATLKRRYVLSGNFRITHSGSYPVILEKNFPYGPSTSGYTAGPPQDIPRLKKARLERVTRTLNVLPANSEKLLRVEQQLAEEITLPLASPPLPSNVNIEVIRRASENIRKAQQEAWRAKYAVASGVAAYPAAGMEPIFRSWLQQNNSRWADWAIIALSHLNTFSSREILAHQVASSENPHDITFQTHRWEAIDALSNMGDKSYLPLLEKLTEDHYHDVQRKAILGLGILGGEKELTLLNTRAHNSKTMFDRLDAITAMGDTASLQAVPLLIELFTLPDTDQPNASDFALQTLTHAHVLPFNRLPSPIEAKNAWQNWWSRNLNSAPVFGPYDCGDS